MKIYRPTFWNHPKISVVSRWLLPFTFFTRLISQYKRTLPPPKVSVPVFCCGNITVGGTGKTPIAIDLAKRLQEMGMTPHFLTRGYKGKRKDPHLVSLERDTANDVGDESLLLARTAPTWRGHNRYITAQKAIAHGANCLIMDDGLQNNSLHKDFSFLIVDGATGFGNKCLLPAGPLREPIENIHNHIHAVIIMGHDTQQISHYFSKDIPILNAHYIPTLDIQFLQTKQIIAFAGIGHPERFFRMLNDFGLTTSRCISYPDHHIYTQKELQYLSTLAETKGAILVTTSKDAVKLSEKLLKKVYVVQINILYNEPEKIDKILTKYIHNYHK